VRSDWRPLQASALVVSCEACHHLFKPADRVQASSDYEQYHVFGDSPTVDKQDFSSGVAVTRSASLLRYLRELGVVKPSSRVLDLGCNRGAFLALLGPGHAGYDVAPHYAPIVEKLGCDYFGPASPPPAESFDVLTLIHVAEHLLALPEHMQPGLRALRPGGCLVIQVPDPLLQPTDLYVLDHRSHFQVAAIDRAMEHVGLRRLAPAQHLLAGELTVVYAEAGSAAPTPRVAQEEVVVRLRAGEHVMAQLRREGRPAVVFGAGLLGSLLATVLGDQAIEFVDDSVALRGTRLLGRPVVGFDEVPADRVVVVAVPPSAVARVEARCRERGYPVAAPFWPVTPSPMTT
jgi:SAM-dependent methyltransferase